MALVDYSSSSAAGSDTDEEPRQPAAKHRKVGSANSGSKSVKLVKGTASGSAMPPLPSAFHDLYASTVRHSVVDDPSLHQGRKRQNPHVPGNWPSHLYVEWHPTKAQHDTLAELVGLVEADLGNDIKLHNFLTSDLGAHLPLHISLSRPLSLPTADKDAFLEKLTHAIRNGGTDAFAVHPSGLAWYRSPDSDRTFLVLGVATSGKQDDAEPANAELTALLTRCNAVATLFGQPALYQGNRSEAVGAAFHVSIGWTFGLPDEEASRRVLRLFERTRFRGLRACEIEVSGVKAKIGNVVSHIALAAGASKAPSGPLDDGKR
ncbi:U6 snRNA phosphodiesterase [Tolypocladium ophioglossoides CBS 100239]|uniref:U6 snRNA phosphodiesterase n=1 Tax=Tolypocladium ophioglossoides (strain CBS 100239) TaxID=1163406 RepID=A0A0L0MZV2_TOLOC|nr:U6 snRNA phosphodiesterase [Tolypocladium ophioglossoides CBS 100239]